VDPSLTKEFQEGASEETKGEMGTIPGKVGQRPCLFVLGGGWYSMKQSNGKTLSMKEGEGKTVSRTKSCRTTDFKEKYGND